MQVTEDKMAGWHHRLDGEEFELQQVGRTQKPGVLQSVGSKRVRHDWAAEPQIGRAHV